ncbi:hypothetical protein N665_1203s0002 [Sinapis alba]|nr:hypothetical protein N665_1203s0002 [Sinapis alba]
MLCFQLNIKKKYELWSLVGPEPVRFALIEFEHLTSLNCKYIENLENLRFEVMKEMASFWEGIGVSVDAGPTSEQIIGACHRCQEWSRDDRMRRGYLAIFTGFIEGRKYSTATRASLARLVMDLEKFENYPWGVVFKVLMDSLRAKDFSKSYIVEGFIQVFQTRGINYVEKDFKEMFSKWDNDTEDEAIENIIQVMFNAPSSWKWTMNCWEDASTNRYTNPKTHVVYVKKKSSVKSLVVREEVSERPSKKARIEVPAKPRSEDLPEACSEAFPEARSETSIPMSGVDKRKQDRLTAKNQVAPKAWVLKPKKEVKEAKEKEVKETKEKEVKEKARVALEKEVKEKAKVPLEKAKEAKLKEAKEAKIKEAKSKEAKAKEAEEAKAKEAKAKEA